MSRASARPMLSSAGNAGNTWPGLTPATAAEFTRIGRGQPVSNPNRFRQRHERYYHVVDYPTAGATTFTFFNVPAVTHICNLNNGIVPDERPFWLTGLCITFQNLTALASGSPSVTRSGNIASVSANAAATRLDEIASILQAGLLTLRIGDQTVLEVQDLTHFPSDGGVFVGGAALSFAAATAGAIVPLTNGNPQAGNRFRLPGPYAVLPSKPISATITFQSALSITAAGRIKMELVGESVVPQNW